MKTPAEEKLMQELALYMFEHGISDTAILISYALDEWNGPGTSATKYYHKALASEIHQLWDHA